MVITVKHIDFDANLYDIEYEGVYNGVPLHEPDLNCVLNRAWSNQLERIIIPGNTLRMTRRAVDLARQHKRLYCTVGCQPTILNAFQDQLGPEKYHDRLVRICNKYKNKVVALGKCGLDYSPITLESCPKETQIAYLKMHFAMCEELDLPVILHCRSAFRDLIKLLQQTEGKIRGVIHSFDGTLAEAQEYLRIGLYIGISGHSLKAAKNLEVVNSLPLKRMLFGTDCPQYNINEAHAGYRYITTKFPTVNKVDWTPDTLVKGRNEPVKILQVLEVVAGVRNIKVEFIGLLNRLNIYKLFFPLEDSGLQLPKI